jgi:uncharacterized protein (DUF362 family)
MMIVTPESSAAVYDRLIKEPIDAPKVPYRPRRPEIYLRNGKHVVSLVRTEDRVTGLKEAFALMGGLKSLCEGVKGGIIIKPNCNTDDPFPRNTSHETVRVIAEGLIGAGFPASKICVGDASGRFRGFPTRHTIENMGIKAVADDLGIQVGYFEEEEWVTVNPPKSVAWPMGIRIPRRIYEAERVILTPVMRPHRTPVFTIALKLPVGIIDPVAREWLHNNQNENFINKMIDLSLTFTPDLIVTDGMKLYTSRPPTMDEVVAPGILIVGSNSVAADTVAACIMKQNKAYRMESTPVREHLSFVFGEERGIGSSSLSDIELLTKNLTDDKKFGDTVNLVKEELSYRRA